MPARYIVTRTQVCFGESDTIDLYENGSITGFTIKGPGESPKTEIAVTIDAEDDAEVLALALQLRQVADGITRYAAARRSEALSAAASV